jgi:Rho-binding antiterminator
MNTFPSTKTDTLLGPMTNPNSRKEAYIPVDCDFTDELEYAAIRKFPVEVSHWDERDELTESRGRIADIYTKDKEEFLKLSSGEDIRLDHIARIRMLPSTR